jgi:tetratricopeptide (TPR) repeat protein
MNNNRLEMLLGMYDEAQHDSFILFAIAKEYEYQKNIDKAIQTYEQLRARDPQYVGLFYHLAALYQEREDYTTAMVVYEDGIDIAKKQADFHALSELLNAKQNLEIEM